MNQLNRDCRSVKSATASARRGKSDWPQRKSEKTSAFTACTSRLDITDTKPSVLSSARLLFGLLCTVAPIAGDVGVGVAAVAVWRGAAGADSVLAAVLVPLPPLSLF